MANIESLKYLNYWSVSLLSCIDEIEKYFSFWTEHKPSNSTATEDEELFGIADYSFDPNPFTLEMIISTAMDANGDSSKLIYDSKNVRLSLEAEHLLRRYSVLFKYVSAEVMTTKTESRGNYKNQLVFAKELATIGKDVSTLPD